MDILGTDILGWDCSAPSSDFTDDKKYDLNYDLWELNCCVVRDAYWRGDADLWDCVLTFWNKMLSHQIP